jgi:group I intron endonuclease
MYDIYVATNLVNNKKYVGQSIDKDFRWTQHKRDARNGVKYPLYYSIRKYGVENFSLELIEKVETHEEANFRETFWIAELKTQNRQFGYNIKAGGAKGPLPDSMKQDISEGLREYHANILPEEKSHREEKLREANKVQFSDEENRRKHAEIIKEWSATRTEEEKELTSSRQSESQKVRHASKTPEQRAETARKISEALLARSEAGKIPKNFEETCEKSRIRATEDISKRKRDSFGMLLPSDPKMIKTPEEKAAIEAKRIESLKRYFAKKKLEETHA